MLKLFKKVLRILIRVINRKQAFRQKKLYILGWHLDPNPKPKSIWVWIQNLFLYIVV